MSVPFRAAVALLVVLAGCSSPLPDPGHPTVTADGETVEPGESATIAVEAEHVTSVQLGLPEDRSARGNLTLDFENATVEPKPDSVAESYPPVWNWEAAQSRVRVEIPVHAAANATPGTYVFTVTVRNASGGTATTEIPVAVTEDESIEAN